MVFMSDEPAACDFAEADGEAEFEGLGFSGWIGSGAGADRCGVRDIFSGGDFHVTQVERDGFFRPREECVPRGHVRVDAAGLKGRRDVEHQDRGGVICTDGGSVRVSDGLGPIVDEGADLSGVAGGALGLLFGLSHK